MTSKAKALNQALQESTANLPNAPKFPIGFAAAREAIESLAKYFTRQGRANNIFPVSIPCYELKHPERFSLGSSDFLPIMTLAELYSIGKIDRDEIDISSTQAKILHEAYQREFMETGGSGGVLDIPWPSEIDITNYRSKGNYGNPHS